MAILPERNEQFEAFIAPARARPALWRLLAGALPRQPPPGSPRSPPSCPSPSASRPPRARLPPRLPLELRRPRPRHRRRRAPPAPARAREPLRPRRLPPARTSPSASPSSRSSPRSRRRSSPGSPRPPGRCHSPPGPPGCPLSSRALLVQTAAEELAFRGYLCRASPPASAQPLDLAAPPRPPLRRSCTGTRPNSAPTPGSSPSPTAVIGLVLADVTARTGNLSAADRPALRQQRRARSSSSPCPSPLAGFSLWLARVDPADTAAVRPLLLADLATTLAA